MTASILDPRLPEVTAGKHADQASQWRLMWWAFRRHRLAMAGLVVVTLLYLIALFAEFLAPFDPQQSRAIDVYHPPQMLRLVDVQPDGSWRIQPHVVAMKQKRDPLTLAVTFEPDSMRKIYVNVFGEGWGTQLFGVIPIGRHLLAAADPNERFYLLGADRLGRDMLSRIIYGTRVSMSIGLVGVALSLILGLTLGGISGYFGGGIDFGIQRVIEFILSLPTIPLWLGLTAALPQDWLPAQRYFVITIILSLVGWTELARVVRGKFLALRHEDFVTAARLDGCRRTRVIFRHMLPSMTSHIIASVTLAIPQMILAETALSFLGLGLLPPTISWGVLLKEAQNIHTIAQAPWLFTPGAVVMLAVLSLNFLGDGLRDAADPYAEERH